VVLVEGLEVIPGLYTHAAALALGAALAGLGAWQVQSLRYDARIADMQQAHAQALADATQKAMDDTIKMQRTKDAAIQQAEQRAAQNAAAAAAARRTVDGLRDTLYAFRASLPSLAPAAVIERADTAAELFGACAARYTDVAAAADRHASDAMMLLQSWPKTD
jgi:regulator of protease activity HflC (stomatin/prohibitin superfamily)